MLDQRSLHLKTQTRSFVLNLHLAITLHRQNPLKQSRTKPITLWLAHGRPAVLSPFQMELSDTLDLNDIPPDFDIATTSRQSPVTNGVRGQFVEGHADRHCQIRR